MITMPPQSKGHLATAWMTGIALAVLGVGVYGVAQPLVPERGSADARLDDADEIMVMDFVPSAAPEAADTPPDAPPDAPPEVEVEIPPLPQLATPLTPPAMVELTPLVSPPLSASTKPRTETPRAMPRAAISNAKRGGSGTSDSELVTTFTGGGGGRFPPPGYPAAARSKREEGVVRLLVTVEASGMASAVSVQTSSGSASLDNAARDQINRRWRWPAGAVRKFIVPVRFRLE